MNTEKYNRPISLLCPTCGNAQFISSEQIDSGCESVTCASCGRELTRDELIRENSENIDVHIKEIGKEVTKDMAQELKKQLVSAFKGSKHIKIK